MGVVLSFINPRFNRAPTRGAPTKTKKQNTLKRRIWGYHKKMLAQPQTKNVGATLVVAQNQGDRIEVGYLSPLFIDLPNNPSKKLHNIWNRRLKSISVIHIRSYIGFYLDI